MCEKNAAAFDERDFIKNSKLLLSTDSPFFVREAYNSLRTRILFTRLGVVCPVYTVSSANIHDGKSLTSVNIAISFALAGKRTLLIDADMRNPTIHQYFRTIRQGNGLSEYLGEITEIPNINKDVMKNLDILTAGVIPPNPAELLSSQKMGKFIEELRKQYDIIFFDTPPIGSLSDALLLINYCNGTILVAANGVTKKSELASAISNIRQIGGAVTGVISNDLYGNSKKSSVRYRYNYGGYYYGYGVKSTKSVK